MSARVTITITGSGEHVWTGSLRAFLRGNEFPKNERREICAGLRRNPVRFGGGAAAAFTVSLVQS